MPAKNEPAFSLGWATDYARSYTYFLALSRKIEKVFKFSSLTRNTRVESAEQVAQGP
jgi:hypothetical protein